MAPDQTKQAEVVAATDVAEQEMRPQTVPVNVYETDAALVIVAPLPAVQPEDVMIDVTPGQVRITAGLRSAAPRDYLVHEWFYGGFEREVEIPAGWGAAVEASLANGQLGVRARREPPRQGGPSSTSPPAGRRQPLDRAGHPARPGPGPLGLVDPRHVLAAVAGAEAVERGPQPGLVERGGEVVGDLDRGRRLVPSHAARLGARHASGVRPAPGAEAVVHGMTQEFTVA